MLEAIYNIVDPFLLNNTVILYSATVLVFFFFRVKLALHPLEDDGKQCGLLFVTLFVIFVIA